MFNKLHPSSLIQSFKSQYVDWKNNKEHRKEIGKISFFSISSLYGLSACAYLSEHEALANMSGSLATGAVVASIAWQLGKYLKERKAFKALVHQSNSMEFQREVLKKSRSLQQVTDKPKVEHLFSQWSQNESPLPQDVYEVINDIEHHLSLGPEVLQYIEHLKSRKIESEAFSLKEFKRECKKWQRFTPEYLRYILFSSISVSSLLGGMIFLFFPRFITLAILLSVVCAWFATVQAALKYVHNKRFSLANKMNSPVLHQELVRLKEASPQLSDEASDQITYFIGQSIQHNSYKPELIHELLVQMEQGIDEAQRQKQRHAYMQQLVPTLAGSAVPIPENSTSIKKNKYLKWL